MARSHYIWCKIRMAWVPAAEFYRGRAPVDQAPMVISDLAPYRAAAADKNTGKRPVIGGRRQHREFLKANNYVEVGNERTPQRREDMSRSERIADIKRAMGD